MSEAKQEQNQPPFSFDWFSENFSLKKSDLVSAKFTTFALLFELCFKPDAKSNMEKFIHDLQEVNVFPLVLKPSHTVCISKHSKETLLAAFPFRAKPDLDPFFDAPLSGIKRDQTNKELPKHGEAQQILEGSCRLSRDTPSTSQR